MDNSSGQHVVVSKPLGVFCLRCHAGTSSGLPYFDKEDLAPAIRESETLKVLCQDVVKAYHEPNPGDEVCTDDVRSTTATTEELRCVYNAFERSAFMSQHSGCTPRNCSRSRSAVFATLARSARFPTCTLLRRRIISNSFVLLRCKPQGRRTGCHIAATRCKGCTPMSTIAREFLRRSLV